MLTISLAVSGIVAGGGEEIAPPPKIKLVSPVGQFSSRYTKFWAENPHFLWGI